MTHHTSRQFTAALISSALFVGYAAGETNLLKNGDFEQGIEGWGRPTAQLIEDERAAHSGTKCVAGKVEAMRKYRGIAQELDLDAKRVYRLSCWMRSPERARAIVHVLYGQRGRIEVVEARSIPKRWRRYEAMFSPRVSGKQTLRFAIPSAFGATGKPGQVFLDDAQLAELPQALPPRDITQNRGYNDWPTMAADGTGSLWAAWISYVNPGEDRKHPVKAYYAGGGDKLMACSIRDGNAKPFEIPVKCDGNILWPHVAAGRDGAWLVWTMEVDHQWDVYATKLRVGGSGDIVQITNDPSVATKACGAVDGSGRLWVAWEGNKHGGRDVYCTMLSNGRATEVTRLTDNPTSDQNPTICATPTGAVCVAWDSFRDSNYDIYMRQNTGGRWGSEIRLTDQPVLDRRPHLVTLGEDAWIAWDNTIFRRYGMSSRAAKRIRLGKIAGGKLMSPKGMVRDAILHRYAELPTLAMDGEGRLWVAMKRARGKRGDWDTWLQCYSGGKWGEPVVASCAFDGVTRRSPMAYVAGKLHLIWQYDDRPNRPQRIRYKGDQHSNIVYSALDPSEHAPPAEPLQLVEYETQKQSNELAKYRARFNEDAPEHFTIDYNGEKLSLYWGVLHEHTEISQCNAKGDGSPDTNFAEARDIARLDFAALTDHGQDMIPYDWQHLRKVVSVNHDPGRFISYLAEEWAGGRKKVPGTKRATPFGHRNLIFADEHFARYFDPVDDTPPDKLWEMLRGVNQVTIPHQLADGGSRTDWTYVHETHQPVAEIFQNRGSYEYFGAPRQARIFTQGYSIQDQWAKGTIIGVIASPDHGGGGGKAAVFAPELTRESILDACRKRRTYGTTAARVFMDVRVNGRLMGEVTKARPDQKVMVSVNVIGAGKIKRVEVAKDNRFVYTVSPKGKTAEFTFEDAQPRQKRSFYYVRVLQEDNEIAWSSPAWVE